jgi:uncharacterized protein YbjT (DUF2867 family)
MILVTGATGNVGREAVRLLLDAGIEPVAVTRDPAAALPDGARVMVGDPSRLGSMASALDGVEAILLSPRSVGGATAELLALAAARGATRVVVLSAVTVAYPAGLPRFAAQFRAVEDAATSSGLRATMLRCADFDANALAWAPQIRATGTVRGAYRDAITSPIDERDVAAVAVRALLDPSHAGRSYLLTGPEPLSQDDKVRLIGRAVGRELAFEELQPEQVRAGMLAAGLPEEIPDRLLGSLADYAKQPGPTSTTVAEVLGRPARTFAEWAVDHAAAFRSDGSHR